MKTAVEAVLFAAGRYLEEEFIGKLLKEDIRTVRKALKELQKSYEERTDSSLRVSQDGTNWKLTVRDEYLGIASKLVSNTEIQGTVLETLAIIAWKNPIMQSELVKIRGPAAYEHISELLEKGFITKSPEGRTYKLGLLDKFFDYFDVEGREDLRKLFQPVTDSANEKQAAVDAQQAEYDAQMKAAAEAASGTNTPVPMEKTVEKPSAQLDIVSAVQEAARALRSKPLDELDEAEESDAEPEKEAVEEEKPGKPTQGDALVRTSGNAATAAEIAALTKAVQEFHHEVDELKEELKEDEKR